MTSTPKKILKSSASRMLLLVTNIGIGFYMLPFLIHSLGDEHYGLWVLVGSVIAFYNLMDFGMATAMQRFLVRAIHGEDAQGVNTALSTSFILSSGVGLLAAIVTLAVIGLAPLVASLESNTLLFQTTIGIMGAKVAVQFPLFSYYGALVARYRFDIISYVQLATLLLRTALIVYFVSDGYGIIAIAVISSLSDLLSSVIIIYYAKKQVPGIRLSISSFSLEKLREYFHFGKYVYIIMLARRIRFSIDELVVGAVVGLGAVTHYAIASTLIKYFITIIGSAFGVTSPLFNKYHKLGQWENLREIFLVTSELAIYASFLIGGLLISLGEPFISIWIGEDYSDVYLALLILCIASILINAQKPNHLVVVAIAKHKYYAKIFSIEAIANLSISIGLAHYIGIYGVALGTMIPSLFNTLWLQPIYVCKQLEIRYSVYYRMLIKGVMLGLIVFMPVLYVSQIIIIETYLTLFAYGAVASIVYTLICFKLFLGSDATSYIIESVPSGVAKYLKLLARDRGLVKR